MAERRRSFLDSIIEWLLDEVKKAVQNFVGRILRAVVIQVLLFVIGIVSIAAGIIYLSIGFIAYLSLFMPGWLAWQVIGGLAVLGGALTLLGAVRRARSARRGAG